MLERGKDEMLAGRLSARTLGLSPGDRVELMRRHVLMVSGVFDSGRGVSDSALVLDLEKAQEVFGLGNQVSMALLRVHHSRNLGGVVDAVETAFPHLTVSSPDLWSPLQHQQVEVAAKFARAIGLVALLVAGLGMANTMMMNVMERSSEIGILRAVGWRRRQIVGLVLAEVSLMAGLGAALSLPLGNTVLALMIDFFPLWLAEIRVAPSVFTEGVVLAVTASFGGTCPAVLAVLRARPVVLFRAS